jgi:glycosyltransferase involved in cell wall biosynthesis
MPLWADSEPIMDKTPIISAIILAKNEEKRIHKAIESLSFADEIILIDNDSTDATASVAQKKGIKVFKTKERSFSVLRNIGKKEARGRWLLYLDADELIPQKLASEIEGIVRKTSVPETICFFIKRDNHYMGHPWPVQDRMQRLFYKEALVGWVGDLHETAQVRGKTGQLEQALLHDTHRNLEEMLDKTNIWSHTEAMLRYKSAHPPIVGWRLLRVFLTGFWQTYVLGGGWRAGTVGMIESMYQGFSLFITYAKLWELQERRIAK